MRTHKQIIDEAGGYQSLAKVLGLPVSRVRFWNRRKSIPHDQWAAVASAGVASLEELALAGSSIAVPQAA